MKYYPIILVGPTGVGKSEIGLNLAKSLNGEIICADSMQIYKGMNIGTASVPLSSAKKIKHHGFNVIDPKNIFNVKSFVNQTQKITSLILSRFKYPILIGGTGFYLKYYKENSNKFDKTDDFVFGYLDKIIRKHGKNILEEELNNNIILENKIKEFKNTNRVLKSIEQILTLKKNRNFNVLVEKENRQIKAVWIYVMSSKKYLMMKIRKRIEDMYDCGLLYEAQILKKNIGKNNRLLKTMGYQEALEVLNKKITIDEAKKKTFYRHKEYIKRQIIWLKKEYWWSKIYFGDKNMLNQKFNILEYCL